MTWSAKQYSRFEAERTRPVRDLVAAIPTGGLPGNSDTTSETNTTATVAIDLGCGPGNSTEVLAARFPEADITGLDSADDMLAAARARMPAHRFELDDIASWSPKTPCDVILANASLQWVDNHATLYPKLITALKPGGTLAVQTPDNLREPAHTLAREIAANGPWSHKIGHVTPPPRHDARFYYTLLAPLCHTVDIWQTTYFHVLTDGPQAVVEWFKGSALRPYLAQLDDEEKTAFLERYLQGVKLAYPPMENGAVLLPFPRLFVVATR